MAHLLQTGILHVMLIYSQLIETCKVSTSKFKYVVLLLGILKSVMWVRHTPGGSFKDDTDNRFFNQGHRVASMQGYFCIGVTVAFTEN